MKLDPILVIILPKRFSHRPNTLNVSSSNWELKNVLVVITLLKSAADLIGSMFLLYVIPPKTLVLLNKLKLRVYTQNSIRRKAKY